MATIRDVARESKTSIATVSRILSNDPGFEITPQTRKSVLDAVQKLNYTARPYHSQKKKTQLGCVLALTAEKYSDPFFTSILSAAEEECIKQNATISIVRNYNELENPSVLSEICSYGLSGLILMEELPKDMLAKIQKAIPYIVTVDYPTNEFNSVGFDNYEANVQVMSCLLDFGYRRIAYIGGSSPGVSFENSMRMVAYRDALFRSGIAYDPALVVNCKWDLDLCAAAARELLSAQHKPDAIFAGSDTLASVVLSVIHSTRLKCPQDIGVIGFNNINMSAHTAPPLTTIDVSTKEIGMTAVRRLMELVQGKDSGIMKISYPTKLVIRESLMRR